MSSIKSCTSAQYELKHATSTTKQPLKTTSCKKRKQKEEWKGTSNLETKRKREDL
ncbi:4984_t:CDS:2, partial [Dentiscutata erythropus]